jgi:hypothetical protein
VSAPASTLQQLEQRLSHLSHSEGAIAEIQAFSSFLGKTTARLHVFNGERAMVRPPIRVHEIQLLGFTHPDDAFTFLQGDIVSTDSAYFLGERVIGAPKYAVLNSSCDLIPGRRKCIALRFFCPHRYSKGNRARGEI